MNRAKRPWVIILAGGRGERLHALTTSVLHGTVPKQFCRLGGPDSLIASTLTRARALTDDARIVVVVLRSHRRWWQPELVMIRSDNLLVETENRGTALALLRALHLIRKRDSRASVVVLPCDHVVDDEAVLHEAIREAVRQAAIHPRRVVVLGAAAQSPDSTLGWIIPALACASSTSPVAEFVEKPEPARALECVGRGGLRNTLIMAAEAQGLLELYAFAMPARAEMSAAKGTARAPVPFTPGVFPRKCATMDLGRDILERAARRLGVLPLSDCGWTDIGTPERLRAWWLTHPSALAHALQHGVLPRTPDAPPWSPAWVERFLESGSVAVVHDG